MATMPTIEDAERAILGVFDRMGSGPGESVKMVALMGLQSGRIRFTAAETNAALQSMADKGWIGSNRPGFYTLTELGFEQI